MDTLTLFAKCHPGIGPNKLRTSVRKKSKFVQDLGGLDRENKSY